MARLSDALDIAEPGRKTGGLGTKPKPLDVGSMMESQMSKVKRSAQESRRSTRNTQRRQLAEWENNWETSIDDGFNNENPQLTQKKKELSSPTGTSNKIPSNNLVDFVIGLEGFKEKAYWDVKQYTVGYGTKAKSKTEVITKEEALNRLNEELQVARKAVNKLEEGYDEPFTEGQKNALISFTYNVGQGNLNQLSQNGTRGVEEMGDMLLEYVYADKKKLPGLVKRRQKEYDLFNYGFNKDET
tara:strand:- start:5233 stop:5961 length:729 start_codon:yes stop_codon:yes gene_type:complete